MAKKSTTIQVYARDTENNLIHLINIIVKDKLSKDEIKHDFREIYKIWLWNFESETFPLVIIKHYLNKYRKSALWQKMIAINKNSDYAEGIIYVAVFDEITQYITLFDSKGDLLFSEKAYC